MKLQKGRPENTDNRLNKEIRVYDFLDKLGIQYQRIDHEAAMTMEACEEIDHALGDNTTICKNLFLCNRQETDFYLLLMPGDKPFKTKDLSAQIHSARLSFAKPEYMEKYLDITPGSVSVLGLMNDSEKKVQLLIDEDVMKEPYFGCHPCINTGMTAEVWLLHDIFINKKLYFLLRIIHQSQYTDGSRGDIKIFLHIFRFGKR